MKNADRPLGSNFLKSKMSILILLHSFAALMALIGEACAPDRVEVEQGVSLELARHRKSRISDVVYQLVMNIDSVTDVNPDGHIVISFDYKKDNQPLQIDFAGERLGKIVVNGKTVDSPVWRDGHIVIEPKYLSEGPNTVEMEFTAAGRALNRNPGYMYTLFVPNRAHSVFPCFDQPDMKASYNLTLTVPRSWKAVSNSPVISSNETLSVDGTASSNQASVSSNQASVSSNKALSSSNQTSASSNKTQETRTITFGPTEPLSTYLFAFAAGDFDYKQYEKDGRTIGAYYRETDPDRLAQLDEIFSQVMSSLKQLEDYTGIDYPFAKYDLVILPGFQFGGMEHTGATFYNDNTLFLSKNATSAQHLSRAKLIAHETSHMWFGDYVTMEWFDDVWTKEVFANYFAAMLVRELLPEYDHDLEWLRVYMTAALDQDSSEGSTPIRQQLDNLRNAGLIYNNIIYNKSPLMMAKLAEITGKENFRKGIRKYLTDHAYGNATWDDLIEALSAYTDADIEKFSRVWVYEKGLPTISFNVAEEKLVATQSDPYGRDIVWPQAFDVLVSDGVDTETVSVIFDGNNPKISVPLKIVIAPTLIIPTADGRAYGRLITSNDNLSLIMADALNPEGTVASLSPTGRLATLMMLNENYLEGYITTTDWLDFLMSSIEHTTDSQMLSALTRYMGPALIDLSAEQAAAFESRLLDISATHPAKQGQTLLLKTLISNARSAEVVGELFKIWQRADSPLLSQDDFSNLSYQLAIAMPERADSIIAEQRGRIDGADRLRKFDYISRAATSDEKALDVLFSSLAKPENRLVEPWTLSVVSLLNHPLRHERSVRYIRPALEMLPQIQATGDIFFPANWSASLLGNYRSKEAAEEVKKFLEENAEMNPLLLNKVRQAASRLNAKQR